jgi:hypothetical protein
MIATFLQIHHYVYQTHRLRAFLVQLLIIFSQNPSIIFPECTKQRKNVKSQKYFCNGVKSTLTISSDLDGIFYKDSGIYRYIYYIYYHTVHSTTSVTVYQYMKLQLTSLYITSHSDSLQILSPETPLSIYGIIICLLSIHQLSIDEVNEGPTCHAIC